MMASFGNGWDLSGSSFDLEDPPRGVGFYTSSCVCGCAEDSHAQSRDGSECGECKCRDFETNHLTLYEP